MAGLSPELIKERQSKLAAAIEAAGLDGLALNPGPSLHYMTGMHFHLSERPVVAVFRADGAPVLVLPELEAGKTADLGYELQAFTYPEAPDQWQGRFSEALQAAGLRNSGGRLGVESRYLRMLEMGYLQGAAPEIALVEGGAVMAQLRMIKDAAEQAAMQKAADIAQQAMLNTVPKIKAGMTEKEVGAELVMQLFQCGSDTTLPFMPIVASGPQNSPNPHAFLSDRKLAKGDLVVFDWGAAHNGYFSDITRTYAVGEVSEELKTIHDTVHRANQAAHAAVKPGVSCGAVDKAARDVIEAAGYGAYFTHRLGHGLGLDGHEDPYMRGDNDQLLEPGMTFTIEPGIYIMGTGGVRIEDDVVVTEDGVRSFTDLPRELQIIG